MFANPITSAIQSKGMPAFFQRLLNISRRYGISPSAMRNSLQLLVNLIQEYDCVATFPITAVTLKRNSKTINTLRNSHIEFCIHGYTHKEYCSLKQAEIIDHLSKASCIFSDMGFDTSGFRSPYLSRSANLYAALQEAGFFFSRAINLSSGMSSIGVR
jgi:peptidoglycan/xylan/chitin deacetylase (PgdA/CDA1 family)